MVGNGSEQDGNSSNVRAGCIGRVAAELGNGGLASVARSQRAMRGARIGAAIRTDAKTHSWRRRCLSDPRLPKHLPRREQVIEPETTACP